MLDTRVMRGTVEFSNRYLVRTNIRLKLVKNKEKKNAIVRFDVKKLSSDKIRKRLNIEARNRFPTLNMLQDSDDVDEEYMIQW